MKKFKFTMQTLLNVKTTMEKQKMGELAECNARIREFERQQEENHKAQERHSQRYQELLEEGLPVAEIGLWRSAFMAMRDRIANQAAIIDTAYGEKARIQKALTGLMQERKMLEKLREKQLEEYRELLKAEDAAAVDEFLSHKVYERGGAVGRE